MRVAIFIKIPPLTQETVTILRLYSNVCRSYKYLVSELGEEDEDDDDKEVVKDSKSSNDVENDSGQRNALRTSAQK